MTKKVVSISALSFGSTGKIMQGIGRVATRRGYDVEMYVSADGRPQYPESVIKNINSRTGNRLAIAMSKLTGLEGCFAILPTLRMLKEIDRFNPDLVHLHLLHHAYVNLPLLFRYLKQRKIPVVWTFHDCWAFTGHCPHFVYEKCEKWRSGCCDCPRYRSYPRSLIDNSGFMWKWKRKWFAGLSSATIVTPSNWLRNLSEESYLKEYEHHTIHNGIDLSVFRPAESGFRQQYGLENKKIVLGVASTWSDRKGLDVFIELADRLPAEYQIVLVGTNETVDQILPSGILSIHRTENQQKLVEIYTAADVYVNPTREDTFPTVNIEALACGTPVVTFRTGGSPESIDDTCGSVVMCDDVDALEKEVRRVCTERPFSSEACIARAKNFEQEQRFCSYVEIYDDILQKSEGGKD